MNLRRLGFDVDVLVNHRGRIATGERQFAGEHLVEHHSQGVDIGALIAHFTASLLRAEIINRAHDRAGLSQAVRLTGELHQTEVHQLDHAGVCQHVVGWLDIAMDDAVLA